MLVKSLRNLYKLPRRDAIEIASSVLGMFGFEDRIIDNVLDSDRRKLFYVLSEKKIVYPDREKVILPTEKREWRTNYWVLNKEVILATQEEEKVEEEEIEEIGAEVPEEVWESI